MRQACYLAPLATGSVLTVCTVWVVERRAPVEDADLIHGIRGSTACTTEWRTRLGATSSVVHWAQPPAQPEGIVRLRSLVVARLPTLNVVDIGARRGLDLH